MKLKGINIFTLLLSAFAFSSCYYDKADLLYPGTNAPCDTISTISYTQHVVPLLQQHCYGCHSGTGPSGNIAMGTYATDKAIALNGKLFGTINYSNGFSPMPAGAPKLSNCNIAIIKKWIDANTPNN
ncbi:MAG TPA: hypothetical protein VLR49_05870 [Ferruginibacter sp.]|nr:hypothetical protein [Ferruginibacter sp.]